jgi:hypothetical protein
MHSAKICAEWLTNLALRARRQRCSGRFGLPLKSLPKTMVPQPGYKESFLADQQS